MKRKPDLVKKLYREARSWRRMADPQNQYVEGVIRGLHEAAKIVRAAQPVLKRKRG